MILGESAAMQQVRRLVLRFGPTPLPVLITGPTGAGKGLVAEAIHECSRRTGHYVVANVATLSEGVIDSELFGHVRGAFTGSAGARRGLVQHADRGTLFLDEIHRLSPPAQSKLLRVLETQLVRPVGSDREVHADFRLVSAANEDLESLVDAGRFQADLLARLSRLVIRMPPLVEHMEDVPILAERFIRSLEGLGAASFTKGALAALMEYDWPRNVRELRTVVERAAILADQPCVDRTDVIEAIGSRESRRPVTNSHASRPPDPTAQRERRLIEALADGGRVQTAATILGVSVNTVYRWMSEFAIPTPERRRRQPYSRPREAAMVARESSRE